MFKFEHELFQCREYQRLTMDTIANCAFGIETSCVHDGNNTFLQKGRRAFSSPEPSLFMKISFLLKGTRVSLIYESKNPKS